MWERLLAYWTRIWFFFCVSHPMGSEMSSLRKSFIAQCALVRYLTRVQSRKNYHSWFWFECRTAYFIIIVIISCWQQQQQYLMYFAWNICTHKRFYFIWMQFYMFVSITFTSKCLAANWTLISPFISVNLKWTVSQALLMKPVPQNIHTNDSEHLSRVAEWVRTFPFTLRGSTIFPETIVE